jgi:hypothetical protein
MIGVQRRKSVMGNGRGALTGKGSKRSWKGVRVAGAGLVLVLAACGILGLGSSHRFSQKASAQVPLSPVPSIFGRSSSSSKPDAQAILSQLPLIFEPNQGQADSGVKFVSRGPGYSLYLDPSGATLAMQTAEPALPGQIGVRRTVQSVRMTLAGANPVADVAGNDPLPGRSNYFIGNDPQKWHTGIPQYAGVHYRSVYPGIDLVFYGSQGKLEYDFKVAPGADPSQSELQFDGATKLELSGGDLVLKGTGADVRLQAPRVYQRSAGQQQPVKGRFVLRAANRVGFEIGAYDRTRELVIDPTISYSTYFGGANGATSSPSIAVNGNGNIYLAGSTTANDLPLSATAPFQSTLGGSGAQNVFIAELNPTLGTSGLLAMTYLGGSGTDTSVGLAVDDSGNAYVAGYTTSSNFPTINAFQSSPLTAGTHVFVSVLNPTFSSLNYSTYLSGNVKDIASGLAIDNNNDAFVTGTTTSTNVATGFPSSSLPVPFQQSPSTGAPIQFFVTEVNTKLSSVNSVPYSTYFGGNNGSIAVGGGIAVDTTGNVYFSGTTNFYNSGEGNNGGGGLAPGDFPILNAYQPCLNSPPPTQVVPPVTCSTVASPEPTDAFVAKLNPNNAQTNAPQLLFSTYFGGANDDSSTGLTIDTTASSIYITGSTQSPNFVIPTGAGIFQPCLNAPGVALGSCSGTPDITNTDAYVAKFSNPTETSGTSNTSVSLGYFSYLGGSGNDSGLAIAVDTGAGALVTGATSSTDFPATTGAIQTHLNGTQQNAFFARINTTTNSGTNTVGSYATYFGGTGVDRGTSITVDPNLNTYFAGDTTSSDLQVQGAYQPTFQGTTMDAFAVVLRPANGLCITCVAPVESPASGAISAGNAITMTFTVLNQGPDLATNVTVSGQVSSNTSATFTSASTSGGTGSLCGTPAGTTATCLIPVLQAGSTVTVQFSVTPTTAGTGQVIATATNGNNTSQTVTNTASFTSTNFSVHINPSSQTVVAGNTAVYTVQVAPAVTFGANVSLSCSSAPVGASCGFIPQTLTFSGPSAQSSTLNLSTTARPPTTISSTRWQGPFYAFWLIVPGAAIIGLSGKKPRRQRLLGMLVLLALFAFIIPLPACSKAKQQPVVSGTPAGTYTLTITATSGSFTQSAGFSLTVQ